MSLGKSSDSGWIDVWAGYGSAIDFGRATPAGGPARMHSCQWPPAKVERGRGGRGDERRRRAGERRRNDSRV
ncbi:hypothetical protein THAOC_23855, partial [Thalassiosira oceanica]